MLPHEQARTLIASALLLHLAVKLLGYQDSNLD